MSIEIKTYADGGTWVKAPCLSCKELVEDAGPYVEADWYCWQCWQPVKLHRLNERLKASVAVVDATRALLDLPSNGERWKAARDAVDAYDAMKGKLP